MKARTVWMTIMVSAPLVVAWLSVPASGQQSWNFATDITCTDAPVYGLPFDRCSVSDLRIFRIGKVKAWRLLFSDLKSECAVGYYKLIEPQGDGRLSPVAAVDAAAWLRNSAALKGIADVGSGWTQNGPYISFRKENRHCMGFVRNGPVSSGGNWILGAAFCRESGVEISPDEAQFITQALRVN